MKATFTVDVPFEIPTLRFVVELDPCVRGKLWVQCYFDKGGEMYGLALRLGTIDDLGRCAQLLAKSAAWTVEALERWPFDRETWRTRGDESELRAFAQGKPLFAACAQGCQPMLEQESSWP